ncbi:MAG: aminotransferase class III-fold pyridoxal phosphate-dependent enzyme [Trueperaceae bacterium]|nr:aminotransferase class III-fold pyridoxal phosphate-dependent enzyme [Trueperaceae bacterium]
MSALAARDETLSAGPAPAARLRLPVASDDLFDGVDRATTFAREQAHGNRDLMGLVDILGIGGPFRAVSPWEIEDEEGRHLIHAGGYAAVPFGEGYPPLVRTVERYLAEARDMGLPQSSLSAWRAALEENLVAILASVAPSHARSRVFFSNSGAEAIEAAVKFVRSFRPGGTLINFTRAYHGKTAAALALTPNEEYQAPFRPLFGPVQTLPYGDLDAFETALRELGPDRVTAVIVEPIQGEGGVIRPPAGFLKGMGELCRRHGIPVVADEIQTGLGRTGHWFASVADGLDPDVITLAKTLGGGMVPVAATIAREEIFQKMLPGVESKRHSNTFGGATLPMVVALRSLELIHEEGLVAKARRDGEAGLARLRELAERFPDLIVDVRGAGMLFALQIRAVAPSRFLPVDAELVDQVGAALALRALHLTGVHGCYSINAQRVVRLTPPLNLPENLRDTLFDRVAATAAAYPQSWRLLGTMSPARWVRLARLAL